MPRLVPENHPALHAIAEEITLEEIADGTVAKLIKEMKAALKEYSVDGFVAVAIAAPQIGVSKRLFLIDDQSKREDDRLPAIVAINPKIVKAAKRTRLVGEGCLSVPDKYGLVRRSTNVTLRALDAEGTPFERGAGGLLAQIIQHEHNHLDGILFTDIAEKIWSKEEFDRMNKHNVEDEF